MKRLFCLIIILNLLAAPVLSVTCHYQLPGDLNNDCKSDIIDFAIFAETWLIDCNLQPLAPSCIPLDIDGDGFDVTTDCNDLDPTIFPGAEEFCDGLDNDCDSIVDEDDVCIVDCDDGNPCTADLWNATLGCINDPTPNNGLACDDGDLCTTGEICGAGVCVGGVQISCDDGNPCTDDMCNFASGCMNDPNPNDGFACDDGIICTTGDTCVAGVCSGYSGTQLCDLQNGVCAGSTKYCSEPTGWQTCSGQDYSAYSPDYESYEISCNDGLDNDCDGLIDCDDDDCASVCLLVIGESCTGPSECLSGFCVDGVCCDTSCDSICIACVQTTTGVPDGTCAPVAAFTDPDSDCSGGLGVCAGTGNCM